MAIRMMIPIKEPSIPPLPKEMICAARTKLMHTKNKRRYKPGLFAIVSFLKKTNPKGIKGIKVPDQPVLLAL